jgi:hypothetical protein
VTWRARCCRRFLLDLDGAELLLEIPDDWDAVVRADAGLTREWQEVVRRAFESLFARGYAAVGFAWSRGTRPRAGYVLGNWGGGTDPRSRAGQARARGRPKLGCTYSSPVASGSDRSDDHSLHEPA